MTEPDPSEPTGQVRGEPALIIIDDLDSPRHRAAQAGVGTEWHIGTATGPLRHRVELLGQAGSTYVEDIWLLTANEDNGQYETVLHLSGEAAKRLVEVIRSSSFEVIGGSAIAAPGAVSLGPEAASTLYRGNPEAVRTVIKHDGSATDVVAVAHRRDVVERFRQLLTNEAFFDGEVAKQTNTSKEGVWQDLFEAEPWLLGLNLGAQLFVSWDPERLERVITGYDVDGPGKRADALLRTAGAIRLLTFAEIKHHRTDLLDKEYRSGCWAPSPELSGAVAQALGTVQLAQERHGAILKQKDAAGMTSTMTNSYIYQPRSYVIAGRLSEFATNSGHHQDKIRSFELFRRHLNSPEILTFDELLARAEAIVSQLERGSA